MQLLLPIELLWLFHSLRKIQPKLVSSSSPFLNVQILYELEDLYVNLESFRSFHNQITCLNLFKLHAHIIQTYRGFQHLFQA